MSAIPHAADEGADRTARRAQELRRGSTWCTGSTCAVEGGEFVVFVGPSGCGKSTLLRMIAGLEDVTDGDILIAGRDVTDVDPAKRGIAMVFQSYALYPHMTVRENLAFGLEIARTPTRGDRARRSPRSPRSCRSSRSSTRRPGQLSGRPAPARRHRPRHRAQAARLPVRRAALQSRRGAARQMRIEIARLHRELGNTMIFVTHDQTEAMTLADRIVVLSDGRIEQVGTPQRNLREIRTTSSSPASSARRA